MPECLTIKDLCKSFDTLNVLDHINLDVKQGERLAIIGPSGAGKTTLLKIIAGLEQPTSGIVQKSTNNIGFVFQEARLIPWRSVKDNLLFVQPDGDHRQILSVVGLCEFEHYFPEQLSGGMRQRVNLARALITQPDLLILDEAFLSLDLTVKLDIIKSINQLWQESHFTMLTVTHDPKEALLLADRILLFSSRPAYVIKDIDVNLPSPRTLETAGFWQQESRLIDLITFPNIA